MTGAQRSALATIPGRVLDVEAVLRGWWLVTTPVGSWVIDEAGGLHRPNNNEREVT